MPLAPSDDLFLQVLTKIDLMENVKNTPLPVQKRI
jgi:hypothetical protein